MPKTFAWPASAALRALPARDILAAVNDAAERWQDADFPPRVRASGAIERRTGYTTPVVDYALDRLFGALDGASLTAVIADELGSLDALDGPIARTGRPAAFACGLERIAFVSSDTTIGVALVPAAFALCAKANVAVKDRDDALVGAFFETLAQERAQFASAAFAASWTGGADTLEAELFEGAGAVVAFGREPALRAIRGRLRGDARFIGYGHRASVGYVAREALSDTASASEWAERAARDAILYDGDGCLSAHILFIERGGTLDAAGFATIFARALERMAVEFPAGVIAPERAAAALAQRRLAAFRAAGGHGAVLGSGDACAIVDPPVTEPPPLVPRVVPLFTIDSPQDMVRYVGLHALPLEGIGLAGPLRDDLRAAFFEAGAVRIAALGSLQTPGARGDHGGLRRIADYVRWIDTEV